MHVRMGTCFTRVLLFIQIVKEIARTARFATSLHHRAPKLLIEY
jgi:hypothetical protein